MPNQSPRKQLESDEGIYRAEYFEFAALTVQLHGDGGVLLDGKVGMVRPNLPIVSVDDIRRRLSRRGQSQPR